VHDLASDLDVVDLVLLQLGLRRGNDVLLGSRVAGGPAGDRSI